MTNTIYVEFYKRRVPHARPERRKILMIAKGTCGSQITKCLQIGKELEYLDLVHKKMKWKLVVRITYDPIADE